MISFIVSSASLKLHVIACGSTGAEEKRMRVYNQENEDLQAVSLFKKILDSWKFCSFFYLQCEVSNLFSSGEQFLRNFIQVKCDLSKKYVFRKGFTH